MTQHSLPLNSITNDVVDDDLVLIGTQLDARSLIGSWRRPEQYHSFIAIYSRQDYEFWAKVPAPIAILGCGTARAPTEWIILNRSTLKSSSLSDLIARSHPLIFMDLTDHPRLYLPLASRSPASLPLWLSNCIARSVESLFSKKAEHTAVAAGLHLLYDDLDGSHALSQTVEGRGKNHDGDYWHAIMHRREPDYDNAKYWFRRVGAHPVMIELPAVFERVRAEAGSVELDRWTERLVKNGMWDPFAFVDACEAASASDTETVFVRALEEIQHFEMLHLLVQSCADAKSEVIP